MNASEDRARLEYRAVIGLEDADDRLQGMLNLIAQLPEDLLAGLLSDASLFPDYQRGQLIEAMAQRLQGKPELLGQAVDSAAALGNQADKNRALGNLGAYADEEQVQQIVDLINQSGSDEVRLIGWIPMAQRLPGSIVEEAFTTSVKTGDVGLQVEAFQAFSGLMTETWKRRALGAAQSIAEDYPRFDALLALADTQSGIGREALDSAWKLVESHPDLEFQAYNLARLVDYVPASERKRIVERALGALAEISDWVQQAYTAINMVSVLADEKEALLHRALDAISQQPQKDWIDAIGYLLGQAPLPSSVEERLNKLIQTLEDPDVRREAARLIPQYLSVSESLTEERQSTVTASEDEDTGEAEEETDRTEQTLSEVREEGTETLSTQAVEDNRQEENSIELPASDWIGESLQSVLNYARSSAGDGEILGRKDLLAGLLAHIRNASEGFASALHSDSKAQVEELLASSSPVVAQLANLTGLNALPASPAESSGGAGWRIDKEVEALLQSAKWLQQDLTGTGCVEDRHLLAAFLGASGRATWLRGILSQSGLPSIPLLELVVSVIHDQVAEDSATDWRRLLLPPLPRQSRISRLNKVVSDDPRGEDKLNLEREYNAFAAILASSDSHPPLAIGLFGDWGSGKSFFMEQIIKQIEAITRQTRNLKETSYCRNIAQIRFNAWHYVDSNLWASLITRVFDGLAEHMAGGRETIVERKKKEILAKLKRVRDLEQDAKRDLQEAEQEANTAAEQEATLERQCEDAKGELAQLRSQSPLSRISREMLEQILTHQGREALSAIGQMDQVKDGKDFHDLTKALGEGWGLLKKLGAVDAEGHPNWKRLGLFVLCVVALAGGGYLIGMALDRLQPIISSLAVTLAPLLGWGIRTVKRFNGHAQTLVSLWRGSDVQKLVTEVSDLYGKELEVARENTQTRLERLAKAQRNHESAQERVNEAKRKTVELDPARMFADFIEENAAKQPYHSQLGLISQIREDLQDLADIFSEKDKRRQGKDLPLEAAAAGSVAAREAASELDKCRRQPIEQVDRIILYVDDLDRCPPKRVAEVLQAVHLLLAFDLFVVVVAVDPRWLHRALEAYYPVFLESTVAGSVKRGKGHRPRATTPRAYLEKIFQIPYVLPRMAATGYEQLVQDLVGEKKRAQALDSSDGKQRAAAKTAGQHAAMHLPSRPGAQEIERKAGQAPKHRVKKKASSAAGANMNPAVPDDEARESEALGKQGEFNPVPTTIPLERHEIRFMQYLHPLVRTPRSAKRLINIYKLIRITLPDDELKDFISERHTAGFRPVLLLLGIVIGFPEHAVELFARIRRADQAASWWQFVDTIEQAGPVLSVEADEAVHHESRYWQLLSLALKQMGEVLQADFNPTISRIKPYIDRVERYSFEAAVSALRMESNSD